MKDSVHVAYLIPLALLVFLLVYQYEPIRNISPPRFARGSLNIPFKKTSDKNRFKPEENQFVSPIEKEDCIVNNSTDPRVEVTNIVEDQKRPDKIGGSNCVNIEIEIPHEYDHNNCVPKILHFIWVGGEIPEKYIHNINTFKKNNPEYEINLWTQVITQNLITSSLNIFKVNNITSAMQTYITKDLIDAETNMGAKSDILRYEVVYRNGGVYFDTDSTSEKPLKEILTRSFVTHVNGGYNNISNSVFGFPKGSKFLKYVLELLRKHIHNNADAAIPWKTGPAFWSGAFLKYNSSSINMIHAAFLCLNKNQSMTLLSGFGALVYQLKYKSSSINMIPQKYLCLDNTSLALVSQTHDATWMG